MRPRLLADRDSQVSDRSKALQELTVSKLLGPDSRPQIETVVVTLIFFVLCGVFRKSMKMSRKDG